MQAVVSGGNVVITIPHDETPCMFYRVIHGAMITSPVQTVLDLLGNAGRGEEAADAIIAKEYREDDSIYCTNSCIDYGIEITFARSNYDYK